MDSIRVGQRVVATTSARRELVRRAVTTVVSGASFRVVWICSDEEWDAAQREGRKPKASPWPATAIRPA